jgi:hypothetical protein
MTLSPAKKHQNALKKHKKTLKKPSKTLKKSDFKKVLMFHLSQNPYLKKITDNFIAYVNP